MPQQKFKPVLHLLAVGFVILLSVAAAQSPSAPSMPQVWGNIVACNGCTSAAAYHAFELLLQTALAVKLDRVCSAKPVQHSVRDSSIRSTDQHFLMLEAVDGMHHMILLIADLQVRVLKSLPVRNRSG